MSELIDRNVLKTKMFQEAFESDTDMQKWDSGCYIRYKLFEKVVDSIPTVPYGPRWHRVEEPPKEDGWYMLGFLSRWRNGNWWFPEFPDYWMAAGAQKEGNNGSSRKEASSDL